MSSLITFMTLTASALMTCNACMFGTYFRYGPDYYNDYDYGPPRMGMRAGWGVGVGPQPWYRFARLTAGLNAISSLLDLMMLQRTRPAKSNEVHHHHHHYYYEKPGGGYDYKYSKEPPKGFGSSDSKRSGGGFSSFFRNKFS